MRWQHFGVTRGVYDLTVYGFIGLYKVLILVFNLVPYISLRIMA